MSDFPTSGFELEADCAAQLYETLDTPVSLGAYLRLKYGEYADLVDMRLDPGQYQTVGNFADDYLAVSFLSKSANIPLTTPDGAVVDRKRAAVDSFWESESRCRSMNDRLMGNPARPEWYHRFVHEVAKVLGPLGRSQLDFVVEQCRHGPGATTGCAGYGGVASNKYEASVHLTEELYPFARRLMGDRWWSQQSEFTVVKGNKFFSVPKNARTERGACAEPTLNVYLQLGIGALITRRLLGFGVDISDQSRNQRLAEAAWRENLATLDLSSASDSISWGLILDAFPPNWVELLTLARSSYTEIDGVSHELEKFCSMGNGFTFPLETCIFYAVVRTIANEDQLGQSGVYGDDIIIPQGITGPVIEALEFLGFKVNPKKTHLAGAFFESCGADYFMGSPVRPVFARNEKAEVPYSVRLHNAIWAYSAQRCCGFRDGRFRSICESLYKRAPRVWRDCRVPPDWGDVGFASDRPPLGLNKRGWETAHFRYIPLELVERTSTTFGVLLSALARPAYGDPLTAIVALLRGSTSLSRQGLHTAMGAGSVVSTGSATYGREPVRGKFGRLVPRTGHATWPDSGGWL